MVTINRELKNGEKITLELAEGGEYNLITAKDINCKEIGKISFFIKNNVCKISRVETRFKNRLEIFTSMLKNVECLAKHKKCTSILVDITLIDSLDKYTRRILFSNDYIVSKTESKASLKKHLYKINTEDKVR